MGEVSTIAFIAFILCILAVCVFEFVNGFHDTANAVATVIYTGTLKPQHAVIWSGLWNFTGVITGGVGVAMGIVKLLPLSDMMSFGINENMCIIFAVLAAAIFWNVFTWYHGIPCSSSHTLFGSLLGVGIVFQMVHGGDGPNWKKTSEILLSLLISPALGFALAIVLMYVLRYILKSNKQIFQEPEKGSKPPLWIRAILIGTCTGVSYAHGSNDGQKGVGLMMIILMTFFPLQFALNSDSTMAHFLHGNSKNFNIVECRASAAAIETALASSNNQNLSKEVTDLNDKLTILEKEDNGKNRFQVRKKIQKLVENLKKETEKVDAGFPKETLAVFKQQSSKLGNYTDWAPDWVIVLISLSLGIGTMVGWERIVVTIGEKIGKSHLNYAQGMVAEFMAATMIYVSTTYKLPVSTTHILSSSVAGTMVAANGIKNLQTGTIKNIGIAWVLTLPVTIFVAGGLYYVFQMIFG